MNFKHYEQELIDRIPILDIGMAVSLLGDLYGIENTFLPYGVQRDFVARGYKLPEEEEVRGEIGNYQISVVDENEMDRMSMFGTPILGSFTINGAKKDGGVYNVYDPMSGRLVPKSIPDFEFPAATIVDFERPKNITKTPVIGASGTVKEIFGFDDWRINIRGICLDDPSRKAQKKAKEQQEMLDRLNQIAGALELKNDTNNGSIFFDRNISRLVIERLSFSTVQGKPGVIQFEIEAYSDEDILLAEQ